jgi:ribosome-binding protein aMBF1 (putative translation factor)
MATRYGRKAATLAELAHGRGDPVEAFAAAPGMKDAREAAGVSLAELAELTNYPVGLLAEIEAGNVPVPRLTTSRISAALGAEHVAVRGEGPQEVTRLKDIQERT